MCVLKNKDNTSGDLINCISCVNIKVNENNDRDHIGGPIFLVKLVHIAQGGAELELNKIQVKLGCRR